MYTLSFSSRLAAGPDVVWQHVSSLRGVNYELWPLHMSGPDQAFLGPGTPLGTPLFRSLLTLLRVVPLDVHEFSLANVAPGSWFHESSRSLLQARWIHVRRVEAIPGGCAVSDDLSFAPRLLGRLHARCVERVFARRHHRLRRRFGSLSPDQPPDPARPGLPTLC